VIARSRGVAYDAAGNPNAVSTSDDNTVTYDIAAPAVTINQAGGQADRPTSRRSLHGGVQRAGYRLATGDVTLSGRRGATTAIVTESARWTDDLQRGGERDDPERDGDRHGPAGVAYDAAGNPTPSRPATTTPVTYDITAPTVTIDRICAGGPDGHLADQLPCFVQ